MDDADGLVQVDDEHSDGARQAANGDVYLQEVLHDPFGGVCKRESVCFKCEMCFFENSLLFVSDNTIRVHTFGVSEKFPGQIVI